MYNKKKVYKKNKQKCENVKRVNDLIVISKNRKTTKFKNILY